MTKDEKDIEITNLQRIWQVRTVFPRCGCTMLVGEQQK